MNLIKSAEMQTTTEYGGICTISHANFGTFKLKPGESIIAGAHKHPEVIYVVKGKVTFIAPEDKEELIVEAGNILTLPANQVKSIHNNGEEDVLAFWVNAVSL